MENGLNLNSNYGDINFGENGWGFKDAFSEDGIVSGSFKQKAAKL